MEEEFVYWRHITPIGVKVEEVTGGEGKTGRTWLAMARQIYCENGRDGLFRTILHLPSGAPLIEEEETRISITHTKRLFAVASLPKTSETDLSVFSARTAMGIDAERDDREQVMAIREKFLSADEIKTVGDSLERCIIAWTAKEALYKAAFSSGLDWKEHIRIVRLPEPGPPTLRKDMPDPPVGEAILMMPGGDPVTMELYTYRSEGYIITIACAVGCARYPRGRQDNTDKR